MGLPPVSQRQAALDALGLQDGAGPEDIRRAFRQKALVYHPDKNLADPEGAAEQFRGLVRAYQRLANPSSDQAWEDLDPADILTEDFLKEAMAQRLPAFELMYIQQRMAAHGEGSAGAGAAGTPLVWGVDLGGHATDALWRKVHAAMQRRRQRQEGGGTDSGAGRQQAGTGGADEGQNNKWSLFWEFVTELVARDADQQGSGSASRGGGGAGSSAWGGMQPPVPPGTWRTAASRAAQGGPGAPEGEAGDGEGAGAGDGERAGHRRRRYTARLQLPSVAQEGGAAQGEEGVGAQGGGGEGQGQEGGSTAGPRHINATHSTTCSAVGDEQGGGQQVFGGSSRTPQDPRQDGVCHGEGDRASGPGSQGAGSAVGPAADGAARGDGKGAGVGARKGGGGGGKKDVGGVEQPGEVRWLTVRNCWVWTRRLLLIKAMLMLLRN